MSCNYKTYGSRLVSLVVCLSLDLPTPMPKTSADLIPFVPSLGTYEVSFVMGGRIQSSSRRIRLRAPRLAIRNDSFDRGGRFEGGCRNARLGHHEDR